MVEVKFDYFGGAQRSPEWFKLRLGRVTSSRLPDWLAVSKAKGTPGKPLKARLDYEKELMFERQFGTSFERYVTPAMQEGIDFENFARQQYKKITHVAASPSTIDECGAWYSDVFVASPDGTVNDDGLLEIKVLRDTSFTEVLAAGVPEKHWQQIQGELWASGREWCDYVAVNLNTRKIAIITVQRDDEFIQWIELTLSEKLVVDELDISSVFDFVDAPPAALVDKMTKAEELTGGWV